MTPPPAPGRNLPRRRHADRRINPADHDGMAPGRGIPMWRRASADDERGVFAPFIAVIVAVLLFLGGIAYDAPRLTAARQDALHAANEAARVAAATIASGGTVDDARTAAEERVAKSPLIYGQEIQIAFIDCVGSRVQVTIITGYIYRSVMGLIRDRQPIEAVGAAEAYLVLPDDTPSDLKYLGECPL